MDEEEEEQQYYQPEEQTYRRAAESDAIPATTDQLLGQDILRTFARISEPDTIEFRKIKRKFPKIETKMILDGTGKEKEVEVFVGWEDVEYEIPIRVQPKYHELITGDIARAFMSQEDFYLYLDNANYCQALHSFAIRYIMDLSLHHNHFADGLNLMVVGSGAVDGQRVTLAKTNIAKTIAKQDTFQTFQQQTASKKKKGFLGGLVG